MSEPSVPDDPIAGNGALPLDAVPGDAIAGTDEALPVQAVETTKRREVKLCIASHNVPSPTLYCQQYYGIPADKVRVVSSWKELSAEIFAHSRIDTLVLLSHGGLSPGELYFGTHQRTLGQFARGTEPDDTDPFSGLSAWSGSVGTLKLEGCHVGAAPTALFDFATKVPATRVEGWSMGRYLDVYSRTAWGDRAIAVAEYQATGEAERAAPYLPRGEAGGTYGADQLVQEFRDHGQFAHFVEVFGESLEFGITPFNELVAQPALPFVAGRHFTRAEGLRETRVLRSPADATALEKDLQSARPVLYRVVAEPP